MIGVIKLGMVGKALQNYLENKSTIELFSDNTRKNLGFIKEVKALIVFICVLTPHNEEKGFDLGYIEESCKSLIDGKTIAIKSTALPYTTEKLQKDFSNHKFLFNSEFLVKKTAPQDVQKLKRKIIGHTEENKNSAKMIFDILPDAPF